MIAELVGGPADGAKVLLEFAPLVIRVPRIPGPDLSYERGPLGDVELKLLEVVRFEFVEAGR